MELAPNELRRRLPALSAAIPISILFITALGIVLTTVHALELSAAQASSWIMVVYGLPVIVSLALTMYYRQPLLLTGHILALIFFASLGNQISYPELVGASILAGAIVLLVGALGLTGHLARWIPTPIVLGMIAGAVMPYVAGIFTSLGQEPAIVGGAFLAYLLSRGLIGTRLPPIFPALVAGIAITALSGRFGQVPTRLVLPVPSMTLPTFSLAAVFTVTPVLVILITLQSNLPSVIFLQSQGYHPPERMLNSVSGAGTLVGSLFGPMAVSLAVLLVPLAAGPDAGDRQLRHWSVYIASGIALLIALLATVAADLAAFIPVALLLTLAGLSLVGVLATALQQITHGPFRVGSMFAFAIALSRMSLLGLGPLFWSLVLGTGIAFVLERDEWQRWRAASASLNRTT